MRRLILVFVLAVFFAPPAYAQEEDFNTRVILKLAQMVKTPAPTTITVDVRSHQFMRERTATKQFNDCVERNKLPFGFIRVQICGGITTDKMMLNLWGEWIPEDDPRHVHILLNEEASLKTLVHEFFHWWLSLQTEDEIFNYNDGLAEVMAQLVLGSPEFAKWLEEERR